jgi:hypothetical protein
MSGKIPENLLEIFWDMDIPIPKWFSVYMVQAMACARFSFPEAI